MTAHVHRHRTLGTCEPPHRLELRCQQLDRNQKDLATWPESLVQTASAPAFSPSAPHLVMALFQGACCSQTWSLKGRESREPVAINSLYTPRYVPLSP